MGFYNDIVLPRLCHLAMRNRQLAPYRRRAIAAAEGRVLEVGSGSGLNFPLYGPAVSEVFGLEPSGRLVGMAREPAEAATVPIRLIEASAETIPLDDRSVDTVVTTWTMCTIPDAGAALAEVRRVLKPGGRLLFVEHGLAPDAGVRRWQDILNPAWRRIAGGCNLNRSISGMVEGAGFRLDRLDVGYMRGLKPMSFMYEGSARPN